MNSPPSTSRAGTTATPTTAGTTGVTLTNKGQAPTRVLHLTAFQSPTGNIGCMLVDGLARCDIVRRSWSPPARPSNCPNIVDYGQGLEVGSSGPGRFVCAGDTARDITRPKLAYGTGAKAGGLLCLSATSGVTCTNEADGHGFFISLQGYRVF